MAELENDFGIESINLDGSEKDTKFDTTQEILDGDEYYKIKEVKHENDGNSERKVFQLTIDDNSDKKLTPDDIKEIMYKRDGYNREFITLTKNGLSFDSGECTANDVVLIYVNIESQNGEYDNGGNTEIPVEDDYKETEEYSRAEDYITFNVEEESGESPYKEMIEKQTGPITHGNRENPEISLTFDDGYGRDNIEFVLDKLKESGIHATFFVLGDCLKNTPALWKKAIKEGHQVCCHTYSHIYLDNNSDVTNLRSGLNKINVTTRSNNVKRLLGDDYYNNLQSRSGEGFPNRIKSDLLLETEILMREEQIRETLGDEYLNDLKLNYPFFRFPGGNGATRPKNIAVLKKLGYLSIGWSEDFFIGSGKKRKHVSLDHIRNMSIENGEIPLFHFKKNYKKGQTTEREYLSAYIENMVKKNKVSKPITETIK